MPIYEYRCLSCNKTTSFFTRSVGTKLSPECTHCQSEDMQRTISSFAYHRSIKSIHEQHDPASPTQDYYQDPRNIGRHVESAFEKHGMEMPESVRDNIEAAREGQSPEGIDL